MNTYYSPFTDKKGNFVSLSKIRFSHILQLKDSGVEEGYKVEFKSRWDDTFLKKHLCQTIASFANSEGGWLLVGIEDDTANYIGIEKMRADFSQIISQKLSSVSPMPKFECRFIRNPKQKAMGVLVVYVFEGLNPPYVCNGTVYLRSGSSKVPIKSGRVEIDNLIQKKETKIKKQDEFCINNFVGQEDKYPYCSVFLFNPYAEDYIENLIDDLRIIKEDLTKYDCFARIIFSASSVVCYASEVISNNSVTNIVEFFANGNIKISCPLFCLDAEQSKSWSDLWKSYNPSIDLCNMNIIDAYISYTSLLSPLTHSFNYLKERKYRLNDYSISFEYKNIRNSVLFIKEQLDTAEEQAKYVEAITNGEFYFCSKNEIKTLPVHFLDDVKIENINMACLQLLDNNFALPFGIDPFELTNKIYSIAHLYTEKTYSAKFKN